MPTVVSAAPPNGGDPVQPVPTTMVATPTARPPSMPLPEPVLVETPADVDDPGPMAVSEPGVRAAEAQASLSDCELERWGVSEDDEMCALTVACDEGSITANCTSLFDDGPVCECGDGLTVFLEPALSIDMCWTAAAACRQAQKLERDFACQINREESDATTCRLEGECRQEVVLDDQSVEVLADYAVTCGTNGAATQCECGEGGRQFLLGDSTLVTPCEQSLRLCATEQGQYTGPLTCGVLQSSSGADGCGMRLDCRQPGQLDGEVFAARGLTSLSCGLDEAGRFGCACEGMGQSIEQSFDATDANGACQAMLDECVTLLSRPYLTPVPGQAVPPPPEEPPEPGFDAGAPTELNGTTLAECAQFAPSSVPLNSNDADCDVQTPQSCPSGTHIDFSSDSACAFCAVDEPDDRTCEWTQTCFRPFVESLARTSGAKSCVEDADCTVNTIQSVCGGAVTLALNAARNEELFEAKGVYDVQNCNPLCDAAVEPDLTPAESPAVCVAGECNAAIR